MQVHRLAKQETLSRYKAYLPADKKQQSQPISPDGSVSVEQFETWQAAISIRVKDGLIAQNAAEGSATAVYDQKTKKAYFENLTIF